MGKKSLTVNQTTVWYKKVPLSGNSATRMVDVLAEDAFHQSLPISKKADYMSRAVDESYDR